MRKRSESWSAYERRKDRELSGGTWFGWLLMGILLALLVGAKLVTMFIAAAGHTGLVRW